jgi:hypothetical protein
MNGKVFQVVSSGFPSKTLYVGYACHISSPSHPPWFYDKSRAHPRTGHKGPEGEQGYSCAPSLTSALDGGGWSSPHPGHFTLDFMTRIIFGEQHESWSSPLFSLLQSPVTSSPKAQISSPAPHSPTPPACVLPSMRKTKFHTHIKRRTD